MNAALRTSRPDLACALAALALVVLAPATARAAEPCAATSRDLLAAEESALSAYAALDLAGFVAATDRLEHTLDCLIEPVTRDLVAEAHRMIGLDAFIAGDRDRARLAFAAARALEPGWRFPESLFPPGHPVRAIYEEVPLDRASWAPLPPTSAVVRLDGRAADARPSSWPTLIQVFDVNGAVLESAYLWPGDPLPALPPALPPTPALASQMAPPAPLPAEPERRGPRWGWLGVAAASAGGAAASYGVALATADRYRDEDTNPAERELLRERANMLTLASGAAGLVAVGGVTLAFVQVSW